MNNPLLTASKTTLPTLEQIPQFKKLIAATVQLQQQCFQSVFNHADQRAHLNAPFHWPANSSNKIAVLFIHGLFDSPFATRDISQSLVESDISVRSILLPGHGTVPGDLLNVKHKQWQQAVRQHVTDLKKNHQQVWLVGYSLGGALAINQLLKHHDCAGLILIAPAIDLAQHWWHYAARLGLIPGINWASINPQNSSVKYESIPFNAIRQISQLIKLNQRQLKSTTIDKPILLISTTTDEIIDHDACMQFIEQQPHPSNQAIVYSANHLPEQPNTELRSSCFEEYDIIDFSHIGLLHKPDNIIYGQTGSDCQVLSRPKMGGLKSKLGALSPKNCKNHLMQRLTYNPDFDYMSQTICQFITTNSHG